MPPQQDIYPNMRSAWDRLAEALGIKTEVNWDAANKRRQMQQYGTMDRRNRGPSTLLKTPQQVQRMQQRGPRGPVNPNAMAQIPVGSDTPGQGNPLFAPPPRSRSPLATPPNSPQSLAPTGGREDDEREEDEGVGY